MSKYRDDPRVSADWHGRGFTVHTDHGNYHVLDNGALGWGIFAGPNLDLVFTPGGPAIGAADPDDLIGALLDPAPTQAHTNTNTNTNTGSNTNTDASGPVCGPAQAITDRHDDDCDGM